MRQNYLNLRNSAELFLAPRFVNGYRTGFTPTMYPGKYRKFEEGSYTGLQMRSNLPAQAPANDLGMPWKLTWRFQRIAEMPVIARDAGQTLFNVPSLSQHELQPVINHMSEPDHLICQTLST
eukprot:6198614-Pleurochrysis_carterae.AAC.3